MIPVALSCSIPNSCVPHQNTELFILAIIIASTAEGSFTQKRGNWSIFKGLSFLCCMSLRWDMKIRATTFCKIFLLVYLSPRSKFCWSQIIILTKAYHVSPILLWENRASMIECEMFTSASIHYISQRNWSRESGRKTHLSGMIWTEAALQIKQIVNFRINLSSMDHWKSLYK